MGNYVNPVSEVIEKGRQIQGGSYEALISQCKADEELVGVYSVMTVRQCAPVLDTKENYLDFESAYHGGMWLSRSFYALALDRGDNCAGNFPNSFAPAKA
jgi:hypothetical protein